MMAALIGLMVAVSAYLMLSGNLLRFLFGLSLLSNAVNLAIFESGRLSFAAPPFVEEGAEGAGGRGRQRPAAGADPDRHRDRLRPAGLHPRAGLPRLRRLRHGRDRRRSTAPSRGTDPCCSPFPSPCPSPSPSLLLRAARRARSCARRQRRRRAGAARVALDDPPRCAPTGRSPARWAAGRRPSASRWRPILLSGGLLVATALAGLLGDGVRAGGCRASEIRAQRPSHLRHVLLGGVSGAFVTGDLFNLYVWFEVLLIASFGLLVLRGGRRADRRRGEICGAEPAGHGGDPDRRRPALRRDRHAQHGRSARRRRGPLTRPQDRWRRRRCCCSPSAPRRGCFPVFFWLPASYHTPSVTVSALFSALLTKVAVYALPGVHADLPAGRRPELRQALLWVGCATMVSGRARRGGAERGAPVLAFHIVSQIGYMALGLALWHGRSRSPAGCSTCCTTCRQDEPVPDRRDRGAALRLRAAVRRAGSGRAARPGADVSGQRAVDGRHAALLGLLGQVASW
jgi:hypothetical protein